MQLDRDIFLLLVSALSACHRPEVQAVNVPVGAAGGAVEAPRDVDRLCAAIADENAAVAARLHTDCGPTTKPEEGRARLDAALADGPLRFCKKDSHGVWAVKLAEVTLDAPAGESGTWCGATISYALVYATADGARVTTKPRSLVTYPDSSTTLHAPIPYDYDGDGRNELFVKSDTWYNGGGGESIAELLRAGPRAIEPYPVGFPYTDALDVDEDGRPDLVNERFFSATGPCGLAGEDLAGPSLLVHALPGGGFTMNDGLARRWAIRECPSPPVAPPYPDPKQAGCARLWGRTSREIVAPIRAGSCGMDLPAVVLELVGPDPPFRPLDVQPPSPLPPRSTP
jgi:hypothetical protein